MRKCPKCSSQYNDDPKICRVCGAILEPVAEPANVGTAPAAAPEPKSAQEPPASTGEWTCPACKSPVPASFEICWKCGADRSGVVDTTFNAPPPDADAPRDVPEATDDDEPAPPPRPCAQCGSSKIIPNAQILDQGRSSDGVGYAMVDAHPEALIFKDRRYGRLGASICGNCGHVELRVENPRRLYEHWRRSQE